MRNQKTGRGICSMFDSPRGGVPMVAPVSRSGARHVDSCSAWAWLGHIAMTPEVNSPLIIFIVRTRLPLNRMIEYLHFVELLIQQQRQDQHDAKDHQLVERLDMKQVEPVAQNAQRQNTGQRAP